MLPPFYITTEVRAAHRDFGHYMTNWGASLSSIMFGMTGLQLGRMGTSPIGWGDGRVGALPNGWERISYEGWLGQRRNDTHTHFLLSVGLSLVSRRKSWIYQNNHCFELFAYFNLEINC